MKISVIKNGYLSIYFTTAERQKYFPATDRIKFTRDEGGFWLEGTQASVKKHTAVRSINRVSSVTELFVVTFSPEVHRYQFHGTHLAQEINYDAENGRLLLVVPHSFFEAGKAPRQRNVAQSLATNDLAEAERAIRLLNGLVDRGRLELVLREGHVKAVARVTLGG